jgi:low affinity Fe/Cu permease
MAKLFNQPPRDRPMFEKSFSKISTLIAYLAGLPITFILCTVVVLAWAVSGPFFGYSDTWQLVINTGTTIVTFLMVFLIQNTQNRDGAAVQAKLDELIRVGKAQNLFIGIEHLTESEVQEIRAKCERAAKRHDEEIAREAADKATSKALKAEDEKIAARLGSGRAASKAKRSVRKPSAA